MSQTAEASKGTRRQSQSSLFMVWCARVRSFGLAARCSNIIHTESLHIMDLVMRWEKVCCVGRYMGHVLRTRAHCLCSQLGDGPVNGVERVMGTCERVRLGKGKI